MSQDPDSAAAPVVLVEHLTKHYGARCAVSEVSFDMRPGEVLGLLGPNGSGKSTILRILTGYLQPTSGSAQICGFDVVSQSLQARRCVGYVPEDVPLYPQMRVHEFLAFMGRLRGLEGGPLARAIEEVFERLSFGHFRNQLIGKLSRGYRQRVAIAQALLARPKLLVLDEPTNGLDPRQIIEVRELIRSLAGRHTVLLSSHILGEVGRIADRVGVLLEGRLRGVREIAETPDLEDWFLSLT